MTEALFHAGLRFLFLSLASTQSILLPPHNKEEPPALKSDCSDALYEYTGKDEYISRRTIQLDLQKMRSDELGYNAPIVVKDKRYYTYEDPDYSITNIPLTENDLSLMSEAVGVLKQLSGFTALSGMEDIVGRLDDQVSAVRHEKAPVIFFENNERLVGLNHISPLYQAIVSKSPVELTYQSFTAYEPHSCYLHMC